MRWRQWNEITRVGVCKQNVWMEETCKQRSSRPECDAPRTPWQRTAVVPAQPVPSPTTPPHTTAQHSTVTTDRHTHTHSPTSKHAEPNQAAQKQTQKPTTPQRPSTHLPRCARAGTSSCSSPSSFLHLCLSLSPTLAPSILQTPFLVQLLLHSTTRQSDTQTCKQNRNLHLPPLTIVNALEAVERHHKSWGLQAECVDGRDVQAKIESS